MAYTVSQADPVDSGPFVVDLWKHNLPTASAGRFPWLYAGDRAKAWLLHTEDSSVVGAVGLMSRAIQSPQGMLQAGQAIDLNVDLNHRTVGPALSLTRTVVQSAKQQAYKFVYSLPNAESEPVLKRVGYRFLGSVQRWYKPIRCEKLLHSRLHNPLLQKAASVASIAVDGALAVKSRELFYRRPADIHVKLTDGFDAAFDQLWKKAAGQFAYIGERTADYLTWRFGRSPDGPFQVFCIKNACQELLAYLVFSCRDGITYVNDLLFVDASSLDLLLSEFLRHVRRQRGTAVIVVYLGTSMVSQSLRRFGFWRRPSAWNAMVYADWNQLGDEAASFLDEQQWYLTRADIDTDL
ncbi:MAG: hypothetical protein ABFD16_03230 [Thermoguttaceae bacterium]